MTQPRNQESLDLPDGDERVAARDAATGQFTTVEDAAARPDETTVEDVGRIVALKEALHGAIVIIEAGNPSEPVKAKLAEWRRLAD